MKTSKKILILMTVIVCTIIFPPGIILFILGFLFTFILRLRKIEKETYEKNKRKAEANKNFRYW